MKVIWIGSRKIERQQYFYWKKNWRCNLKTEITDNDIVSSPYNEQIILNILKDRGFPVNGHCFLTPDLDNYTWYHKSKFGTFIIEAVKKEKVPLKNIVTNYNLFNKITIRRSHDRSNPFCIYILNKENRVVTEYKRLFTFFGLGVYRVVKEEN